MNNLKRFTDTFHVSDISLFKQQMLSWANQFSICCFFDNNSYTSNYHSFECLLAIDAVDTFEIIENGDEDIVALKHFIRQKNDWLFGHIAYDFKNSIFPLASNNQDETLFPNLILFQPKIVVKIFGNNVVIESIYILPKEVFDVIVEEKINSLKDNPNQVTIQPRISRKDYISTIEKIKHHIQIGDCYEMNFCQEFFAKNININPLNIYNKLNTISPTPFSSFYKLDDKYLLCASPERYIKKIENQIISQPIKGTAKRNVENQTNDIEIKKSLLKSQKERSENVMIVDLVRNDLSKIATKNSVKVDELFGIYSFPQVHQMISTISATLKNDIDFSDVLKATFPMGSMTGAPKFKVMQLIEQYEQTKRGIYSGCVGYITPEGDFDFNVVIRSIMYNEKTKYLSYQVGGAITHYSNPEDEYEECLLKAQAMEKALQ